MNVAEHWIEAYGADHTHRINRLLHALCIPLSVLSIVGLLWSLPVPERFRQSPSLLNWGTLFLMASIVYYFVMSMRLAVGSLPFLLLAIIIVNWLQGLATPLWVISAGLLFVASVGFFVGHALDGHRGSVLRDLHHVMIGPLWLLARLYRRLHLRY